MKVLISILLLCLAGTMITVGQTNISGTVYDKITREPLIGATIQDSVSGNKTITDLDGNYTIALQERALLRISYVGYNTIYIDTTAYPSMRLDIALEEGILLESVLIEESVSRIRDNVGQTQVGKMELSVEQMKMLPVFLGEMDILKSIQLMPGVQSGSEASSGFYVRGGASDQNLILYDGVPVYNPFHAAGFMSIFNMDVLKDVTVYKGGFGAQYGGRVSSVIDIESKPGNMQQWELSGGIGLVTSRLTAQGPVIKNKLSVLMSGRAFYSYALARTFMSGEQKDAFPKYSFYDVNGRVDYKISNQHQLYLSFYSGGDVIGFKDRESPDTAQYDIPWTNNLIQLTWKYVARDNLSTKLSAYYSKYDFTFGYKNVRGENVLKSGIGDIVLQSHTLWLPADRHKLSFGGDIGGHGYLPNVSNKDIQAARKDSVARSGAIRTYTVNLYAQHDWELSDKFGVNYGIRLPFFYTKARTYLIPEPRVTFKYQYSPTASFKGGYTLMSQSVHLLTNSTASTPLDLWIPSSDTIKPQIAHQVSLGWFKNFRQNMFESNIEVFYKKMLNQIEYEEGQSIFQTKDYREIITFGQGWAAGSEFFIRKRSGKLNGFVAYTLMWSRRRFELLNSGLQYNAKYDRRHDLSVALNYNLNDKWSFSGLFVYGSGNWLSLPSGRFFIPSDNFMNGSTYLDYSKNNYRLRAFHRLDLGIQYKKEGKRITNEFRIDIYNVYSRLNPFFLVLSQQVDPKSNQQKFYIREYSILPIIPSFSYNFKIK